jgi:hypothetical protein
VLRWEVNITMDFKDIRCEGVDWIHANHNIGHCEQGNEPFGSVKRGEFLVILRDYQILNRDCVARN